MTTSQKISIGAGAIILLLLMLWSRSCGIKSVTKRTGSDTVVRVDSFIHVDKQIVPVETIKTVTKYVDGKKTTITIHDTLETFEVRIDPVDTAGILARFQDTAVYDNTIPFNRGSVRLREKVSENRIKARQMDVTVNDSVITNTITIKPPRKMVGYFTLSGMGSIKEPFGGAGAGFGLKLPNERVYQMELKTVRGLGIMAEGTIFFPIRFKKQ